MQKRGGGGINLFVRGGRHPFCFLIVSLEANVINTSFDQKSQGHPEEGEGGQSKFYVKSTYFYF